MLKNARKWPKMRFLAIFSYPGGLQPQECEPGQSGPRLHVWDTYPYMQAGPIWPDLGSLEWGASLIGKHGGEAAHKPL